MKIGVKCGIHNCTIEFMKQMLNGFYSHEDINIIKKAFDTRIIAQYYVNKVVSKEDSDYIMEKAPLFFVKSKEIESLVNI